MNTLVALRSAFFKKVRIFFDSRNYLEVDPPILSRYASVDVYIDPFSTTDGYFLHTSPEYAMKRILSKYKCDIYFLGHVFRKEEEGSIHSSEFTMIEWYKINTNENSFLQETCELISLFVGEREIEKISYKDAFLIYGKEPEIDVENWFDDEIKHYIWATYVEPHLGKNKITIICDFPESEALLAKTHIRDGEKVAQRFEIYFNGVEIGNGFCELSDANEQERRLNEANNKRLERNKDSLPIDYTLIEALRIGLPSNTYGIAIGFDRLLMLSKQLNAISHIMYTQQ